MTVWTISNRGGSGVAGTASQAAPSGWASGNIQVRLRAIQASVSGGSSGTDRLVVRDGATGVGAILMSLDLAIGANGTGLLALPNMDLRATPGNALTVEFANGVAGDLENVNAQGDFVPIGYPLGMI